MAPSKTTRPKAATAATQAAPAKKSTTKTARPSPAETVEAPAKPSKAVKTAAEKAKKPAAKAAKPAQALDVTDVVAAPKPARKAAAKSAAKASDAAPAAAVKPARKTAPKAAVPAETAVEKPAKKSATKTAPKAPAKTAPKAAAKSSAKRAVPDEAPVEATPKARAKAPAAAVSEPATEAATKAASKHAAKPAAKDAAKDAAKGAKKTAPVAQAPAVVDAPAVAAPGKPARSRKGTKPGAAAPVAALVAEVAAALEQPVPAEEAAPRRGRRGARGTDLPVAAEAVVASADDRAQGEAGKDLAPARKERKDDRKDDRKRPAKRRAEVDLQSQAEDAQVEAAAVAAEPAPDWRWHKPQAGLFGSYAVQTPAGALLATVELQGSGPGRYRCTCEEFLDSEAGDCAHSRWLIAQLEAARAGQAQRLAAGPDTPWSELTLSAGWQRQLVWRLGQGASEALQAVAQDCADEQGRFIAPLDGPALPSLLQAAAAEGHELRVAAEVWQQLALTADAGDRVERLAARFEQGLASPALHALVKPALPDLQWEAALFAVCAGRAVLADESPLPQRTSAIVAARLWQSVFELGAVAIVAPAELQAAWQEEARRLLGAWPEAWQLCTPDALDTAAGCELLIVDAIDTLMPSLPALQALGAPQLLLLSQRELLDTPLLAPLVGWIDEARRGPYAALRALGRDVGKRQQREVLESVMLSRRRRDLAASLPTPLLAQLQTTALHVPAADTADLTLDAADVQTLRRLHQRWTRVASLSAAEQLQLQQALLRLRQGEGATAERIGEARAQALVRLLPELVPGRAERVVVFAQQDAALRPIALALQDLGLPLANLRQHQSGEVRAMELQAWAEGEAMVLLATDAACAGLALQQPGCVLVHADLCWNPALMGQRLARLDMQGASVAAWSLVLDAGFDPAVLAAHGEVEALPSALQDAVAGAIPFLAGADLQVFMDALGRALAALSAA